MKTETETEISSKEDFFETPLSESSSLQNKLKEASMLYTITPEGKIRLHRDLSKWRKASPGQPVGKNEYYETAQALRRMPRRRNLPP